MPAVQNALVVGGGAAGAAAAILLAEGGVSVTLIESKSELSTLGSGITLQGNALRVFRHLGVWDRIQAQGFAFDTLGFRAPDADGTLMMEMDDARTGGDDLPATVGMSRPTMARILVDRATEAGATIRFGMTIAELAQDKTGVDVTFADGSRDRYDIVIGADGIRSQTRHQIGIDLQTRSVGMGIWRVFAPRPASVTRTDLIYGGPCYIAGYCPTGDDLYAYLVEDAQDRSSLSPEESLEVMRDLAGQYHGPWDEIRATMTDPAQVNYTWFESHLIEGPWNRGRVVLIGDAAHTCPPTLAQGAAQALEDAVVLADVVLKSDRLDQAAWDEFHGRRLPRARQVVEASNQLCTWLLAHEQGDVPALMGSIAHLLSEPV